MIEIREIAFSKLQPMQNQSDRPPLLLCLALWSANLSNAIDHDPVLSGAAFAQRALTWDRPINESFAAWFGTHNSFNYRAVSSNVFEDPHNQNMSLTDQLNLGVRYLELDPHTIQLKASDSTSATTLVCHTDRDVAAIILEQCSSQWVRCEVLGARYYGDNTGCNPVAPTLEHTLAEIYAWHQNNPNELLLVYIDGEMTNDTQATIVSSLGRSRIFARADFNGTWPTSRALTSHGITTVVMGNAASDIAFSKFPNAFSAKGLQNSTCPMNAT